MNTDLHKSMRTEVNEDTEADTYMASEGMTFVKGVKQFLYSNETKIDFFN